MFATDEMVLLPWLVLLAWPHFKLREVGLYLLFSTRPLGELDAADEALRARLDDTASIVQLKQRQPRARARLQRCWNLGACEFAAPTFRSPRKRILAAEPRIDDAICA